MSTLARNIKRKLKLNYMINLRITDTEGRLNITGTTDEAGLKDGMSVMVSKITEKSSTETEEGTITVRVQRLTSKKIWTVSLPLSATTVHLYHQFAADTHIKHGHFILYRSNGVRVSRYTTIGNLFLRKDETLVYVPIEPLMVEANWLDNTCTPQSKLTYIAKDTTVADLREKLKDDLFINFDFTINAGTTLLADTDAISQYERTNGKLVVYICRIGQLTWDTTSFTPSVQPKEVVANVTMDVNTTQVTMEATDENTMADFAHKVYSLIPEAKGKMLEDHLGLPYQLTDKLEHTVPVNGMMLIRVNQVQEYSADELHTALQTIAITRETTVATLLAGPLSTLTPCV